MIGFNIKNRPVIKD